MSDQPCSGCGVVFSVAEPWGRCGSCETIVFAPRRGPLVLVGHESESMVQEIAAVLMAEDFSIIHARDGEHALRQLREREPKAAVLDVALGGLNAIQIIDEIRVHTELGHIKVVLLASVFNRTAYKRRPSTLYGADDYVEQHHIPDLLPVKLGRLLGMDITAAPPVQRIVDRIKSAEERTDLTGPLRVRALANAIMGDIALYHEAEVDQAIRGRSMEPLDEALVEGRRVLAELVGTEDYPSHDPILDAYHAFTAALGPEVR